MIGVGIGWVLFRDLVLRTLQDDERVTPGRRLARLLELPRKLELLTLATALAGALTGVGILCASFGCSLWVLLPVALVVLVFNQVVAVWKTFRWEAALRPAAMAEFGRWPAARPRGRGFLWIRYWWYLPACFAATIALTLVSEGIIAYRAAAALTDFGAAAQALGLGSSASLNGGTWPLAWEVARPVLIASGFVALLAGLAGWALARRICEGSTDIRLSIEGAANGIPRLSALARDR